MMRPITRRRREKAPAVESLEPRQLLSVANPLPPGKAAEIVSQSFHNARPAPQSPSPATTRVSVATDRPSYAPGQPIQLTLTQAVSGNTPVNTGPLGNYDVIVTQRGRELWRLSDQRGPSVTSHVLITMQPGESRQVSTTWDGRARNGQVVTGPIEIRAEIDRVVSSPRTVQIGAASPAHTRASAPAQRPSPIAINRPSPIQAQRPGRDASADLARARQLHQQQLQRAAEARQASFDRPSRPAFPAFPAARRI